MCRSWYVQFLFTYIADSLCKTKLNTIPIKCKGFASKNLQIVRNIFFTVKNKKLLSNQIW